MAHPPVTVNDEFLEPVAMRGFPMGAGSTLRLVRIPGSALRALSGHNWRSTPTLNPEYPQEGTGDTFKAPAI